jgi:hypothetical protein
VRRRRQGIAAPPSPEAPAAPNGEGARLILEALERENGRRPSQKPALTPEDLRGISKALASLGTMQALRDRPLVGLGFGSGEH